MTTKRKPYNTYTKEFKLEALRMMDESDSPSRIKWGQIRIVSNINIS